MVRTSLISSPRVVLFVVERFAAEVFVPRDTPEVKVAPFALMFPSVRVTDPFVIVKSPEERVRPSLIVSFVRLSMSWVRVIMFTADWDWDEAVEDWTAARERVAVRVRRMFVNCVVMRELRAVRS